MEILLKKKKKKLGIKLLYDPATYYWVYVLRKQ